MKIDHLWFKIVSRCFFPCAGKIIDFSNTDVAVDQYHRFEVSATL